MVLIFLFERDLLVPIAIGGGVVSAWAIGFALESIHKKPLTSKQKKMTRLLLIIVILLVIGVLFGAFSMLRLTSP